MIICKCIYEMCTKYELVSESVFPLDDMKILNSLSPGGERVRVRGEMPKRARNLRKNMTDAEKRLWSYLRNRRLGGYKFRRQKPIGSYIVDFVCIEKKVVIEIDGGQHAVEKERDERRTGFLEDNGYMVLRFWNSDVMQYADAVLNRIVSVLSENSPLTPTLSPEGEGKLTV